jgi:cholesterol oxidase
MRRLSSLPEEIKPQYQVVVIGSGYGGAIAASRLSRAGQQVCLLERGKELLPGEYPNTLMEATAHMQVHTADGHTGSKTGLFDFHIHKGISVLVGCGLGGTSLINANVSIKPEDRVFDDPRWPASLRNEFKQPDSLLMKGYALAKGMLKATPLPDSVQLHKLDGLKKSADAYNNKFYRTDINVNFDVDGPNHVGVEQKPCNLCGDCCSGCNNHAKNTVLMNYLPDAKNYGAEIFTEIAVSYIEKKDNKWLIHFSVLDAGTEKFNAPTEFIEADIVILSAGTLGSTEILLRSKEKGLAVSDKTGFDFSGNGDVLGFAYNTDQQIDGVGAGTRSIDKANAAGPCITGVIDLRNQPNLDDGMIIEDAAVPGAIASMLPYALALESRLIGKAEEKEGFVESAEHEERVLTSEIRGAYHGAIKNTQTYLLMTHDGEHGKFELKNDKLNIDWTKVGKEEIFQKADAKLQLATKALGGRYIKDPVWIKAMNDELVTVHPLGGCCMGENIEEAVVNHKGQVFAKDSTSGVYENFYITDGSVIPRSLGVNPLITISAVSERCCALIAADHGWTIDYSFNKKLPAEEKKQTVGVQFTETMRGFFSRNISNNDYQSGFTQGQISNESFEFTLTITSDDVYDTIKNPDHDAKITGTVTAPGLSPQPLTAVEGVFNLFVDDPTNVNVKLMKYGMKLESEEGKTYYFKGFKFVHHKRGLDEWGDTSTLYITIFEGGDDTGKILGQGVLHILTSDFLKQIRTMKAVNASSTPEGLKALADFGKYFSRALFQVYGGVFVPDHFYKPGTPPRKKRDLRMSAPDVHPFKTEDGVELLLTRYNGGQKGPVMMVHGFSGNSLTFSTDTVDTNMAEYLFAHGYDIWLFDYRLSNLLPSAYNQHTIDEIAKYDYPAAIEKIKQVSGASQVDVMAHCVGSVSLFMAMMSGLQGVRSIVSAQIAADFYPGSQVGWKSALHVPDILNAIGIKKLTAYADAKENWRLRLYDSLLKFYAVPIAGNCDNPVCHRMTFMFAPLCNHDQLNEATHDAIIEMFSIANMRTYKQLTRMVRARHLLNAKGENVYLPHLDRLNIPITFLHGEKNKLFKQKSLYTTYINLQKANGEKLYKFFSIKDYGHNDCMYGKNAVVDVYPHVLNQFEEFYK